MCAKPAWLVWEGDTMRYVWFLVGALACSGNTADPGSDAGRDTGPDLEDAGPDTTLCDETGTCVPRPCEFVTYFEGTPEVGLAIEQADEMGEPTPLEDGGDAYAVWGFQGGLMLQPLLDVPLDEFEVEPRCAEVSITHTAVEGEEFHRISFGQRYEVVSEDPIVVFDLFSYDGADERVVNLEIVIRTETWARTTGPMQVTIVEGPRPR